MGTNYYMQYKSKTCKCCNRTDDSIHIGKSSHGWTFSFRGYKESYDPVKVKSILDWRELLDNDDTYILNEYGDEISKKDFWEMVESKANNKSNLNHSIECPQGNWTDVYGHSFSGSEFC